MRFTTACLLCDTELEPQLEGDYLGYQKHPVSEFCLVRWADNFGVCVSNDVDWIPPVLPGSDPAPDAFETSLQMFPFVDQVLERIFERRGIPRLGGMSSGKGWSSFALFQRCPHAWRRRYIDNAKPRMFITVESPALAVGSIIHAFLAVFYTKIIQPDYPLTVEELRRELHAEANPKLVDEGYRVFYAYAVYYQHEQVIPLAIELDLRHPRTHESCRYDLIAFLREGMGPWPPGTYVFEHKSSSRFDQDFLEGWANDGEVLGQIMLWNDLGLDNRYGPLQGVIMNLLGKQKEPQFHRTLVAPESWMMDSHREDLRQWDGLIQLARGLNRFPHSRNNCINRYGRCGHWEECATEKPG